MKRRKRESNLFWRRFFAYIIDMLIISFIVLSPFLGAFPQQDIQSFSDLMSSFGGSFDSATLTVTLIVAILTLLYWSVLEYKFRQSVGKMILNLEVKSITKKKVTFRQALLRNITKLSSLLLALDTLYMLFKKKGQRYSDYLVKTTVVRSKR